MEIDSDMKEILRTLSKYPEGTSVNELYRTLKDSQGRYLMAKQTFHKKLDILKAMGLVIEEFEDREYKRGKKKIIKLRDHGKLISRYLNKIRLTEEKLREYVEKVLSKDKLTDIDLLSIIGLREMLIRDLRGFEYLIVCSDLSDELKKFLLLETEKTVVNLLLFDNITNSDMLRELARIMRTKVYDIAIPLEDSDLDKFCEKWSVERVVKSLSDDEIVEILEKISDDFKRIGDKITKELLGLVQSDQSH